MKMDKEDGLAPNAANITQCFNSSVSIAPETKPVKIAINLRLFAAGRKLVFAKLENFVRFNE